MHIMPGEIVHSLFVFLNSPIYFLNICRLPQYSFNFSSCKLKIEISRNSSLKNKVENKKFSFTLHNQTYGRTQSEMKRKIGLPTTRDHILPYFSRNRRAFSRKDGHPSISSRASRIGLPTTRDLIGRLSLPGNTTKNLVKMRTHFVQ